MWELFELVRLIRCVDLCIMREHVWTGLRQPCIQNNTDIFAHCHNTPWLLKKLSHFLKRSFIFYHVVWLCCQCCRWSRFVRRALTSFSFFSTHTFLLLSHDPPFHLLILKGNHMPVGLNEICQICMLSSSVLSVQSSIINIKLILLKYVNQNKFDMSQSNNLSENYSNSRQRATVSSLLWW